MRLKQVLLKSRTRVGVLTAVTGLLLNMSFVPAVFAAPIGGERAAVLSPFTAGVTTGNESPSAHPAYNASFGFGWDMHGGPSTAVYPRIATTDGAISMKVVNIYNSSNNAGSGVDVEVKVDNVVAGKLRYSHLVNLGVSNNETITTATRLGNTAPNETHGLCKGFVCSSSWNVHTTAGIHTHMEFSKACYGSQGINTAVDAGAGIALLSQNYSATHKGACDAAELSQVIAGSGTGTPPAPTALSRMLFTRGDDMLFAKDNLNGPWLDETGAGWVRPDSGTQAGTIAAGGADGATQLWINGCNALYAKTNLGQGGWTQETECNTAKSVSVSNTNLQMMVDLNGAVWAKYGIGVGGWTYEAAPGTAAAVAAGGDTQLMLGACGAVYAKTGVGYGGWTEEAPCGTAAQVAVSSTGLQMMLNTCGAIYSKRGVSVGGWWAEGDCGWAKQVAVGGDIHMFLNTNGAVYAKTSMGYGGWVEEAANGTAMAIAVGNNGRQMIITSDSSIFAKDSIGVGGWNMQVGPGNAKAIAAS